MSAKLGGVAYAAVGLAVTMVSLVRKYGGERVLSVYLPWQLAMAAAAIFVAKLYKTTGKGRCSPLPTFIFAAAIPAQAAVVALSCPAAIRQAITAFVVCLASSVVIHSVSLAKPRLRPLAYNVLISFPATTMYATTLFGAFLLPLAWLPAPYDFITVFCVPFVVSALGLVQSLLPVPNDWEVHYIQAGPGCTPIPGSKPRRVSKKHAAGEARTSDFNFIQLTDVHLGPFMSEARLKHICQTVADKAPDFVFLTGDFYTPESDNTPGALVRALEPLRGVKHCFASLGNHECDTPEVLETAKKDMAELGIPLLIDEVVKIQTSAGRAVEVVGHGWPHRPRSLLSRLPAPAEDCPRVHLLHSPAAFHGIPAGGGELVLSGHTHGGLVGLVSFGLPCTAFGVATRHPDHGLWGLGNNRLWAHRGQGFRSLTCNWVPRVGVPPEFSTIRVNWVTKGDAR
ncbi:Phosphodiesterase YaeI [Diplonema papillatum]|nr:Phosphodiesterase YaeI [Diplonema papillatum]|eukprot:gene5858-8971_t